MKEVDLAYIAGIVDGEGCIRIKKMAAYKCQERKTPGYHAMIHVKMVDPEAMQFIADTLGGWIYRQKPSCNNGKPLYCFQLSDAKAERALKLLLPYLRVKRLPAKKVLTLRRLQGRRQRHRTKVVGYRDFPNKYGTPRRVANKTFSDKYVGWCERLFIECKRLNRPGIPVAAA